MAFIRIGSLEFFVERDDPRCSLLDFATRRSVGGTDLWGLGLHVVVSKVQVSKARLSIRAVAEAFARRLAKLFDRDLHIGAWKRADLGFFMVDHVRHAERGCREFWFAGHHVVLSKV